jgi:hypothetical protein
LIIDDTTRGYANERQAEIIDAVNACGSYSAAAEALGINRSNVSRAVALVKAAASIRGYSPDHDWTHPVPPTHVAKGVSTYYPTKKDADGKSIGVGQWVKADLRREAYLQAVRDAITEFVETQPQLDVPAGPKDYSTDVVPWIQIGDAHLGMLAHAGETGENFDVKIAERELCAAIGQLIDEMPNCERMVVNDLGDFTHYENFSGTTEASGHPLDFDSRFPKMIKSYARVMRFIVEKCLTKCRILDMIINQGNHSRTNDIWMAIHLRALYEHTGRVNVIDNDSVFIGYRMGKTLVMIHHSDKCKPARLPAVMANDFKKDWGETDFHYIDIGHVHHRSVALDESGATVESWNHLAASDKWAHEAGYRSSKSISVVLRSRTYGEIGRRTLPILEVRDRLYGIGCRVPTKKLAFVA